MCFCKCNFPMAPHVRCLLVVRSVCHNLLKGREQFVAPIEEILFLHIAFPCSNYKESILKTQNIFNA